MTAKAKWFLLKHEMSLGIRRAKDVLPRLIIVQGRMDSGKVVKVQLQWAISEPSFLSIA